jgi:hypothetical protein
MKRYLLLLCCCFSLHGEKFVIGSAEKEGFFSSFLAVLNNLAWADKVGNTPVVQWNEISYYYQPEGYNGSYNPWEYYFAPVSEETYRPGDKLHQWCCAPDSSTIWSSFFSDLDQFNAETRFEGKALIDKYIRIHPSILEKVDQFYQQKIAKKFTIGIHLRGTDRYTKQAKTAMVRDTIDAALRIAKETGKKCQFFIATDEESLLDYAKTNLKGKVLFCDSIRSKDGQPIHSASGRSAAQLGEEILIEALLLSKCDHFVYSLSCVPLAVLLFNPSLPHEYLPPYRWLYQ